MSCQMKMNLETSYQNIHLGKRNRLQKTNFPTTRHPPMKTSLAMMILQQMKMNPLVLSLRTMSLQMSYYQWVLDCLIQSPPSHLETTLLATKTSQPGSSFQMRSLAKIPLQYLESYLERMWGLRDWMQVL